MCSNLSLGRKIQVGYLETRFCPLSPVYYLLRENHPLFSPSPITKGDETLEDMGEENTENLYLAEVPFHCSYRGLCKSKCSYFLKQFLWSNVLNLFCSYHAQQVQMLIYQKSISRQNCTDHAVVHDLNLTENKPQIISAELISKQCA